MKLLSYSNPKIAKNVKKGYLGAILHLAPFNQSGYQVCKNASEGCAEACLYHQGRGRFDNVKNARIRKTQEFFTKKAEFMAQLERDIASVLRKAEREDKIPCIRLNGTSDIPWERVRYGEDRKNIFEKFPDVQFYDYTKRPDRKDLPPNYHLTFSLAEDNDENARTAISQGLNVAVVFRDELPKTFMKLPVVDGDETDLRFLDPKGCIVGLKAKGSAKSDTTGFVR